MYSILLGVFRVFDWRCVYITGEEQSGDNRGRRVLGAF